MSDLGETTRGKGPWGVAIGPDGAPIKEDAQSPGLNVVEVADALSQDLAELLLATALVGHGWAPHNAARKAVRLAAEIVEGLRLAHAEVAADAAHKAELARHAAHAEAVAQASRQDAQPLVRQHNPRPFGPPRGG